MTSTIGDTRFVTDLNENISIFNWSVVAFSKSHHLPLRTGPTPLSKVMRRLMTGYAVTYKKRHKRSGHLLKNRYKSVVCEEDPYLLERERGPGEV